MEENTRPDPAQRVPAEDGGPVQGADGLWRTPWAESSDLMREYYDTEWGVPVRDERGMFERLTLEAFQAGLSWALILTRREAFRRVFADFDPQVVATFTEEDVERLAGDATIVRNRAKIRATIGNAQATLRLRPEGGLAEFVWSFRPAETPRPRTTAEVPSSTPESVALARALRERGFRFVGPTSTFALMEAVGMVDTHLMGSHRRGASGTRE